MRGNALFTGLVVAGVLGALAMAGCSATGKFGSDIKTTDETAINDILDNPDEFSGKTVMVKGQIQTVDDDGKGFQVDNGLGSMIYVAVAGDFKIAGAAKYRLATVEGSVQLDKNTGEPRISATGVDVR
ncbi:MAG: hypothetical protein PVH29_12805 [Candidatus Zixiibacteriota bacterium]|jgi:hypothetical protein